MCFKWIIIFLGTVFLSANLVQSESVVESSKANMASSYTAGKYILVYISFKVYG